MRGWVPQIDTIDLGAALRDAEDIKQRRTTRAIQEDALQKDRDTMAARRSYLDGDESAMRRLLEIDPEGATTLLESIEALDPEGRRAARERLEETGQLAVFVLQGSTEDEQRRRWEMVREQVSPEVREGLPETFDPDWLQWQLARQRGAAEHLDHLDTLEQGEREHENTIAEIDRRAQHAISLEEFKAQTGGNAGLKAADSSGIARAAARLFGGMFDPQTGEFGFTSRDQGQRALAIAARAEEIFSADPSIGHSGAVQKAMEESQGGGSPDAPATPTTGGGAPTDDPLGLR